MEERTRERNRSWKLSRYLQVVVNKDGFFFAANETWTDFLGLRPEEVVGSLHTSFDHPGHSAENAEALRVAQASGLPAYETRLLHADGSFRWISWLAATEDGLVKLTRFGGALQAFAGGPPDAQDTPTILPLVPSSDGRTGPRRS